MGGEKEKSIIFNIEKKFLSFLVLFFKFYLFIYFGLCWVFAAAYRLSLAAGSRRASLAAVNRLPIAVASLVAEHGL